MREAPTNRTPDGRTIPLFSRQEVEAAYEGTVHGLALRLGINEAEATRNLQHYGFLETTVRGRPRVNEQKNAPSAVELLQLKRQGMSVDAIAKKYKVRKPIAQGWMDKLDAMLDDINSTE